MQKRKKEKIIPKGQTRLYEYWTCHMCGIKVEPDACIWQEDDEGAVYCHDCMTERESCGCSD